MVSVLYTMRFITVENTRTDLHAAILYSGYISSGIKLIQSDRGTVIVI